MWLGNLTTTYKFVIICLAVVFFLSAPRWFYQHDKGELLVLTKTGSRERPRYPYGTEKDHIVGMWTLLSKRT